MTRAKVSKARGDKKRCDDLFSRIVRARGQCESCGSMNNLQTSHIRSRHYSHTRTCLLNAHCLCSACHAKWHADGVWASDFLHRTRTEADIDSLRAMSLLRTKFDWSAELAHLRGYAAAWGVE